MIRWVIFVSGEGTNLQNVLDLEPSLKHQKVVGVFADRPCRGLERAVAAGKKNLQISPKEPDFQERLLAFLKESSATHLFLLGYMRLLSADFLKAWKGPLINLHPSLLPKFKGKDAIRQAFEAKESVMGVSLHEVVEAMDSGPILRQLSIPLEKDETYEQITARVHELERKMVRDYLFDLDIDEGRKQNR